VAWEVCVLTGGVHWDIPGLLAATQLLIPVAGAVLALWRPIPWPRAAGWTLGLQSLTVVGMASVVRARYFRGNLGSILGVGLGAVVLVAGAAWLARHRARGR
jgi:hypothetical protein